MISVNAIMDLLAPVVNATATEVTTLLVARRTGELKPAWGKEGQ